MDYVTAQDHVARTGEWWVYDEYFNDDYLKHCKFKKGVIQLAFNRIKEIFDARWYKEQVGQQTWHHLGQLLFPGLGNLSVERITQLGLDIIQCSQIRNFDSITRRLKIADQYEAAKFELEMAAYFRRKGYDVIFNPMGSKWEEGPDLSVSNDKNSIYAECKILEQSDADLYMSTLAQAVWNHPKLRQIPANISIVYSEHILDLFTGRLRDSIDALVNNLADKITDAIAKAVQEGKFGDLRIPGLADVKILSSNGVHGVVSSQHSNLSDVAEIRRIVTNAVDKGIQQLLSDEPGLIAVSRQPGINIELADAVMNAIYKSRPDTYRNLLSVMLVYWLHHHPPQGLTYHRFIIENPYAKHSLKGLGFENVASINTYH